MIILPLLLIVDKSNFNPLLNSETIFFSSVKTLVRFSFTLELFSLFFQILASSLNEQLLRKTKTINQGRVGEYSRA